MVRGRRLELGPDLVDDDHLGHVVLDRLDHDRVLLGGGADLHPPRVPDPRVRDVAVAGDLVGGVDHDHALAQVIGLHAGDLAQHGRLAHARPPQQQDAAPVLDDVADDVDRPEHGPPDPAGEAHHLAGPVADGADPMQGALDPGPVVVAEGTDVIDDVGDIGLGHLAGEQLLLAMNEARLGAAAQVEHHLQQVGARRERAEPLHDLIGQRGHQGVEVVGRLARGHWQPHLYRGHHGRTAHAGRNVTDQQADPADRAEANRLGSPQSHRLICSHRGQHPRSGRVRAGRVQHGLEEGGPVAPVADQEAQVVRPLA
jgi:hypothetical protein